MDSKSHDDPSHNPSSPPETNHTISPIASWIFGGLILGFLMLVVFVKIEPDKFPIIRFLMALSAAFFAAFFIGGVLLRGTLKGFFISATGGFVLFILIQFVFNPWTVLPSASTSSSPSPTPTPNASISAATSPATAKPDPNAVHRFFLDYLPNDPKLRERREWKKADEKTWIERFSGGARMYIRIGDPITVDGDTGTLLQLSTDSSREYFIPDKGSRIMSVRTRQTGGQWSSLGEMKDVE